MTLRWRAPFHNKPPRGSGVVSEAFIEARKATYTPNNAPQCKAIAKSTGRKCKMLAYKGTDRCYHHDHFGWAIKKAAELEAERRGRPVIILRGRKVRNQSLGRLGATTPWPDGVPKREDLLALGPVARGRLFEAFFNKATAPDVWEHELRPRIRNRRGAKNPF